MSFLICSKTVYKTSGAYFLGYEQTMETLQYQIASNLKQQSYVLELISLGSQIVYYFRYHEIVEYTIRLYW